jgi:hypothetical protein
VIGNNICYSCDRKQHMLGVGFVVKKNYKYLVSAFFLGRSRGTRTPKHFVNLTGESKNVKMLEFSLNQLQTYYGYLCNLLSFM